MTTVSVNPLTIERFLIELGELLPTEREAKVHTEYHKEMVFQRGFESVEVTFASPRIRVVARDLEHGSAGFLNYEDVARLSLDPSDVVYRVDVDESLPYWLVAAVVAVRDRERL